MKKPKPNGKDAAHKGIKIALTTTAAGLATLTAGPGVAALLAAGGAALAVELFSQTFAPPLEKRHEKWLLSIFEKLQELEQKVDGFSIESLAKDELFITILIQATQIAIRNHQEQKLTSLRNVILNAALPNPMQEDLQSIFLNWLDGLSNYHIQILSFLDNPDASPKRQIPTIKEYEGKSLVVQVVKDLENKGLVKLEESLPHRGLRRMREKNINYLRKSDGNEDALERAIQQRDKPEEIESLLGNIEKGFGESYTTALGKLFVQFLKLPHEL